MKTICALLGLLACFYVTDVFAAQAGSTGIPKRIYYNSDGYTYILLTTGNNSAACYYNAEFGSHRINRKDSNYSKKISLIMLAYANGDTLTLVDVAAPSTNQQYCDVDVLNITAPTQ